VKLSSNFKTRSDFPGAASGTARNPDSLIPTLQPLLSPALLFYLWLPAGIGLFMGSTQAGRAADWPLTYAIAFFVSVCCVNWWIVDLGCRLSRILLRPWGPPLWAILLLGSVAASLTVVRAANWLIVQAWHGVLPADIVRLPLPALTPWGHFDQVIAGVTIWMLANYVFLRMANLPRYGFASDVAVAPPPAASEPASVNPHTAVILGKMRPDRRGDLLALNAQGHYLRIITNEGEDLILHRFGDAVAELSGDEGAQVHRSWWISQAAIDASESKSLKEIHLNNGLKIPVSRTYQRELAKRIQC
jgi:hypothetical protein